MRNNIISIVPAKYDDIFRIFAESYLDAIQTPMYVIDDGLSHEIEVQYLLRAASRVRFYNAPQPFGFSKSVNMGIREAGEADVIVWNDDCYVHTANLGEKLQKVAYVSDEIGLVTPMMNNVQNSKQNVDNQEKDIEWVDNVAYVVRNTIISFGCVYLKRAVLNKIGWLDEHFLIGREDVDFGVRLNNAGYKIAICYSGFVEHGGPKFGRSISNTRWRAGNWQTRKEDKVYFGEKHGG